MLYYLAVALYVLICLFLIIVVLLQPGKDGGMGAAFGGSSTGSVFGGRGASSVLTKMTTGAAVLFMVLSIVLARASSDHSSVSGQIAAPAVEGAAPTAPVPGDEKGADKGDKPAAGEPVSATATAE